MTARLFYQMHSELRSAITALRRQFGPGGQPTHATVDGDGAMPSTCFRGIWRPEIMN
jgi:hypothetical protein